LGTALLIFFLFHSQAFLNYYYLVLYLLLLGLTACVPVVQSEPAGTAREMPAASS
jgi:hypothetical protein